jgi:hypothetical protein
MDDDVDNDNDNIINNNLFLYFTALTQQLLEPITQLAQSNKRKYGRNNTEL